MNNEQIIKEATAYVRKFLSGFDRGYLQSPLIVPFRATGCYHARATVDMDNETIICIDYATESSTIDLPEPIPMNLKDSERGKNWRKYKEL